MNGKTSTKVRKSQKTKDPKLVRAGVSGYNRPKRTPENPKHSHVVVAKVGSQTKLIRFGQQGVKTNQTEGQRRAFARRHAANIARGKLSAAWWANKVKWNPKLTKQPNDHSWVKG